MEKAGSRHFSARRPADDRGRALVERRIRSLPATTASVPRLRSMFRSRAEPCCSVVTGGDQIWDSTPITMFGGTFDTGGVNESVQGFFGTAGTITNSTGASTLTLGSNNGSSLFGGAITETGGTLAITKSGNGGAVLTGASTYTGPTTITGGYVQIGDGHIGGSISAVSNIVTSTNSSIIFDRSDATTFANAISGAGNLVQNGSGSTTLTGADSYTGNTLVNAGTLVVNTNIGSSAVTVNAGGTLKGNGVVGPIGGNGGIIAPGSTVGLLTSGSVTATPQTTFSLEINSPAAGTGYDQLAVNGSVDLGGAVLSLSGSYSSPANDIFYLILNDGVDPITGTFAGLPEGSSALSSLGQRYAITYLANADSSSFSGGNDVALRAIPEPCVLGGILTGTLALLGFRRPRRRA